MAPLPLALVWSGAASIAHHTLLEKRKATGRPTDPDGLVLEGWAQGFMVGSLIIMACITVANMRKGVLLHKLILLELLLGIWHGFWILFHDPIYAWWLSVSAIFLNASWSLHNVIAWMKIKPFLPRWASLIFIWTVILVQPYWVVEIFANFQYFHGWGDIFLRTRPWEPLCRDPWWIFTTIALFYNIVTRYELTTWEILRISPRFVVMLSAMIVSVIFIIPDVLSVTGVLSSQLPTGINPFFKLSFVFKCLTDSVVLDDFKTALDRLRAFKMGQMSSVSVDRVDSVGERRFRGKRKRSWRRRSHHERKTSSPSKDGSAHMERIRRPAHIQRPSRDRDHDEAGPAFFDDRIERRDTATEIRVSPSTLVERSSLETEYAEAIRDMANDPAQRPP